MEKTSPITQGSAAEKADVVIVGAGAAGMFYAALLAEAGKSVIVLEAGPDWNMGDLTSSLNWSRRLRWGGAPVQTTGDHPFGYGFNAGWGFGGAALHHYGTWPRMHAEDFRMRSLYGQGFDWALDYDELRPWYDRIQRDIGISGDAEAEIWRSPADPYPMPPLETFGQARYIKRGFDRLGIATAPMPMAINSTWYNDRPPCIYDGWCDAGCPIGALANPLVLHMPRAEDAGADIRARSTVTHVLANKKRATGVEYRDAQGNTHRIEADIVILAASVAQNPRLLLNSANEYYPDGLANSSGRVGHYFMTHVVSSVYGFFDEGDTEPHMGVSGAQLTSRASYKKDSDDDAFGSYQWLVGSAMKPNDLLGIAISRPDLYGQDLHDFMARAVKHLAVMLSMGEELPDAENRIELGDQTDEYGMPLARIVHRFSENSGNLWHHMKDEGRQIFEAAGASDIWNGPMVSAHMMGGTIMGTDPAQSVTDSYGRTHDLPNLVIAGSGIFPTSAGVNPTYTIYSLTQRSAEYLLQNWPS